MTNLPTERHYVRSASAPPQPAPARERAAAAATVLAAAALLLALALAPAPAVAQGAAPAPALGQEGTGGGGGHAGHPQPAAPPRSGAAPDSGMKNLQAEGGRGGGRGGIRPGWPSPVNDQRTYTFLLFDNLEFQSGESPNALRYDFLGWHGGDYRRIWFKSEGRQNVASDNEGGAEFQVLYGRLVSPYFDLQAGLRLDTAYGGGGSGVDARVHAVLALQGLSPYRFDVEPALFVDQEGNVSARFTGTYDLLLTQRLILQPRLETNFALQEVPRFNIGAGLSDVELGLRLRYEVRREYAPYVGISYSESFGGTARYARRAGERVRSLSVVGGIRFWY